jgi:DNA-binding MarR family transcriptional regulator
MAMNRSLPRSRYLAASSNGNGAHGPNGNATGGIHLAETPVDDHARQMMSLILSIARRLLAVDDQAAELPLRQLRVCMLLHEGARTMSALSRELSVSLSAMTQIADRLERAGIVKRSLEGSDRRVRCLQLTTRGQSMMRERERTRIQRVSAIVETLSEKSRDEILSAMQVLLEAACAADESRAELDLK